MLFQKKNLFLSSVLTAHNVRHGFTTRLGGISPGPFASRNLSPIGEDDPAHVQENWLGLAKEAAFALEEVCQVHQVHGTDVLLMENPEVRAQKADGMIASRPLVLAVRMADCVPLLLSNGKGMVAALHSGWRGTLQGMASKGIEAYAKLGINPNEVFVAMGPSIGPCCFHVQEDVAKHFLQHFPESVKKQSHNQYAVDLWHANRTLLVRVGVLPTHIDTDPPCTSCHPELFYSHRRDRGVTGQHVAFIEGGVA